MSVSAFNRRWAAVILEALTRHGVQHICIAPGSRSTPLTLAAAENRAFIHHTHFDERGLGHLALGLAKASRQPVAVIVTSGTATANLYPALIEAGLTGEKLILLTADRPPELIDCGANQAIRQPGMFASHPAQTISLPRPSQDIPARWLVSTIDQALGALHAGGVHINCPFAEPLYGDMDETGVEWQQQLGNWWQSDKPWLRQALQLESEKQRDWFFWRQKRGVVVAGRMSAAEGKKVAEWAQTLGWPLIGDVLSQTGQPLPCADLWLGNGKAVSELAQAQIVVQLGSSLTGKRVLQWQATCEPDEYWLVDNLPGRLDPAQHRGRRLLSSVERWLELHPAEKTPAVGDGDPTACRAGVAGCSRQQRAFWRSAAGAAYSGLSAGAGPIVCWQQPGGAPDRRPGAATGRVSGLQQPRRQRHRWPDRHCGRRAARQRPTDAGHRWRSLRALRSQLAGPAAPGVGAAGADRGE